MFVLSLTEYNPPRLTFWFSCANKQIKQSGQLVLPSNWIKVIRNRSQTQSPLSPLVWSRSPHWEIWFQYTVSCEGRKQSSFLQAINKESVWASTLEWLSSNQEPANSIRDQKGMWGNRGTMGAWKGTQLGPGCRCGCVHWHGRESYCVAHKQHADK